MKDKTDKQTLNQALPTPAKNSDKLRKKAAFATLAVEEFSRHKDNGAVLLSEDSAVEEARDWVNYDEL